MQKKKKKEVCTRGSLSESKDASEKAEWHQHPRKTTPFSDHPTQRVRRHLLRSSGAPHGAQPLWLRGARRGTRAARLPRRKTVSLSPESPEKHWPPSSLRGGFSAQELKPLNNQRPHASRMRTRQEPLGLGLARSSLEPLEWKHWLQDPRLPKN